MGEANNIKVFISYSHDSKEHKDRVLGLAKKLESHGIECSLDQYELSPPEGWARWMRSQIRQANFVLVVCTKTYHDRFEGIAESGTGAGAKWEGLIITQELYEAEGRNNKFIPIAFSEEDAKFVPIELRPGSWYVMDSEEGYLEMYARITNQPRAQKGPLGERLVLPRADMASNAANREDPVAENPDLPSLSEEARRDPSHEQILNAMLSIRNVLKKANPDDATLGAGALDPFQIVRNHLLSTALMSLQIQSTRLHVHEAQRLYLYRARIEPVQAELVLLLRMLIDDSDGLIPGWYWFSWLNEGSLKTTLFDFALRDRNSSVRARAWDLMAMARIPPMENDETWDMYLKDLARDESQVKKAGITYLGVVGGMRDLPAIKKGLDDSSVNNVATVSRLLVLARNNPSQVLTETVPQYYADKRRLFSELKANMGKIQSEQLLRALRNKETDEDIKFLAIRELKQRGELTSEFASSLLKDSKYKVAEICYRQLISEGKRFPPDDIYVKVGDWSSNRQHSRKFILSDPDYADAKSIILDMYKSYTEDELWALVDWQSEFGLDDIAYRALALYHYPTAGSRIRGDLDEDFKSYEDPFIESVMPKWVEKAENSKKSYRRDSGLSLLATAFAMQQGERKEEDTPEVSAKKEAEGVKSKYIAAALAGIAANGKAEDIEYARKYLSQDSYDVRVEAVSIIDKFGDEDDIQNLIEVAKNTEGVLQESAALAALKLSPDVKETARSLILMGKEDLVSLAVGYLTGEQDVATVSEFLVPMLFEEADVVRLKVTAFFAKKLDTAGLEKLLDRYTKQPSYYYDVVCWLDKILYAPSPLNETFRRQLEDEIDYLQP